MHNKKVIYVGDELPRSWVNKVLEKVRSARNEDNWSVFWLQKTADPACKECHGDGIELVNNRITPCGCVNRAVFDACLVHYREVSEAQGNGSTGVHASDTMFMSRPLEEWMADFYKIVLRELDTNEQNILVEFMRGHIPAYIDQVRQIQEILGQAFLQTKPYALFPFDKYYGHAGLPKEK